VIGELLGGWRVRNAGILVDFKLTVQFGHIGFFKAIINESRYIDNLDASDNC